MRRPWITCPLLLALGVFALSLVPYAPDWWAMLMCSVATPLLGLLYGHLPLWAVNGVLAFVHYALLAGGLAGAGFLGKRAYQSVSRCETVRLRATHVWYLAQQLAQDVVADLRDLLACPWAVRLCGGACRFGLRCYESMRTPVTAGTLAFLGVVVLLFLVWGPISAFLGASAASGSGAADASPSNLEIIYKLSLIIGGITAFALAAWRGWCHDRQTRTTMQGHITDRFIKASELLGSDQMASRLGGIFMLWRTGKDSPNVDDKRAVLDMLCAFIREPTPDASCDCGKVEDGTEAKGTAKGERETLRNDVRSALALLAPQEQKTLPVPPGYRFDLTGAVLPMAELSGAVFDEAQFSDVNLGGANLSGARLVGAFLAQANLQYAEMQNSRLIGAKLIKANMVKVNLVSANLARANLYEARMSYSRQRGANLESAYLAKADLTGANLTDAKLTAACLVGAMLVEAKLTRARLVHSDLAEANLAGANLVRANLKAVDFTIANLSCANLARADLAEADLTDANLTDANLSDCVLSGAVFTRATLIRARLTNANLENAELTGANMTDSDLINANLGGAILTGTTLIGANLRNALFVGAMALSRPDDLLSERVPFSRNHCVHAKSILGAIFTGDSCPLDPNGEHDHAS